jgi:hypothetical protein
MSNSYDLACDALYDFKEYQRDSLVSLLTSRLWHYEGENGERFRIEHLFELRNSSLEQLLNGIDSETLAYALKLGSPELKNRLMLLLPESKAELLSARMKELGPIRLSEAEEAETVLMSLLSSFVESGDVELSPIHRVIGLRARSNDYPRVLSRIIEAPVRTVLNMEDRSLNLVLREVSPVPWADFIGYAGNVRLLRKVLFNCTRNKGDLLLDRLDSNWPEILSDEVQAQPELSENFLTETMHRSPIDQDTLGISAAESVLRSIDQLECEGQILVC